MTRLLALSVAMLFGLPFVAGASPQATAVDTRWLPWIGCWRPADEPSPAEGVHVCVVPESSRGVRILTLAGDQSISDETMTPDGTSRAIDERECRGSMQSEWSGDGLRVYLRGAISCEREPAREVSGLTYITADGEWIDVQVAKAGLQESVRVRRYRRSAEQPPDPSLIPPDVALRASGLLGTRLAVDHIIDASRHVTPRVVEALLFETETVFPLNKRQLIALDDAGVPDTVIDLMVAFSFPDKFAVRRTGGGAGFGGFGFADEGLASSSGPPWFDYGYGWHWGGGYSYWLACCIIVTPPEGGGGGGSAQQAHGRAVNGTGYTQVVSKNPVINGDKGGSGGKSGSSSASSGSSSSSGSSDSGGSSGGSSSVSSSGYSGGGGGDTGRTAVPRN